MGLICRAGIKSSWRELNVTSRYILQVWTEKPLLSLSHYEIREWSVVKSFFGRIVDVFDTSAKVQYQVASHRRILLFQGRFHIYHGDSYAFRVIAFLVRKDHVSNVHSGFRIVAYPRSRVG